MAVCTSCRTDNPERAKFCLECGTPFARAADEPHESRRVVTVLFSDVVGSTALGEDLDAEAVWVVMSRYFATMQAVIEHHGGTVEKFIGDAIMAVFGLPQVHEDDALRAVRAAAEMRTALAELNRELMDEHGIGIATRTGINTGEVLAADPSRRLTLVTGDAVNVAARLEQAAAAGEILLGRATWGLAADAVDVEEVESVPAKGKAEPIAAVRLVAVRSAGEPRPHQARASLIGRDREIQTLLDTFRRVEADRAPTVVTIVGTAGVGKSRLVAEFLSRVGGDAVVLRGRCLSYGAGITYWPLREMLHAAAGITDADTADDGIAKLERVLDGVPEATAIANRLASAIGLGTEGAAGEEIFWAGRRALEHLASRRPVVAVIEDIHWAEPTLLEFFQDLAARAVGVPLLLLCLARPDLADRTPDWGTGRANMPTILLDALPEDGIEQLFEALATDVPIDPALRTRILATAEGNPLFVEEMLRMLAEGGASIGGEVSVPPNIHALMAARMDRLPPSERSVGQRAAVVGRVFEEPALVAMTPEQFRSEIDPGLASLVRRELVSPEAAQLTDGSAFKFRHILLRDAAYEALTKTDRAVLHERFADWLELVAGVRVTEFQEILGYHLEQAFRYRADLRQTSVRTTALAARAAAYLRLAGRRARDRGDAPAANAMYRRAGAMPSADPRRQAQLALDFALALLDAGELDEATRQADSAFAFAKAAGDRSLCAQPRLLQTDVGLQAGVLLSSDAATRTEVELALADAEASGDPMALALAWQARSTNTYHDSELERSSDELATALLYAERAGDLRYLLELELNRLTNAVVGPMLASEVCDVAASVVEHAVAYPTSRADALRLMAIAEAMLGRSDDAALHATEAIETFRELGLPSGVVMGWFDKSWVDRIAGDLAAAEADLRRAIQDADLLGDRSTRGMAASRLSVVLIAQGRFEEAERWVDEAEALPIVTNRTRVVGARARIAAARGDRDAAIAGVEQVVAMVSDTAFINVKTDALIDAAETMAALSEWPIAVRHQRDALLLAEQKENVVLAAQLRTRLAGFEAAALTAPA